MPPQRRPGPPGPPMGGPPQGPPQPGQPGPLAAMMGPPPPSMTPPSAFGGPEVSDGQGSALLDAIMNGGQMGGQGGPMDPRDGPAPPALMNGNPSLDQLLELMQQISQGPAQGQPNMMGQNPQGVGPGPTDIDPQTMALLMGGGAGPGAGAY